MFVTWRQAVDVAQHAESSSAGALWRPAGPEVELSNRNRPLGHHPSWVHERCFFVSPSCLQHLVSNMWPVEGPLKRKKTP